MAEPRKQRSRRTRSKPSQPRVAAALRRLLRWALRGVVVMLAVVVFAAFFYAGVNPPTTPYMFAEGRRLGGVEQTWVAMDGIAPVMGRSVVAAEDANFCLHWGLDVTAIRAAMDAGGARGASTISQQVVKNVYLWHGRTLWRKALEAAITPVVEAVWSKRRILEVYLNIAEFDTGVFGVQAAARHYFGVDAADLTPVQAARLAAILPDPKGRSASNPSQQVRARAGRILDGAETIRVDGRAACFER
ncbi:MAG: monofunctional biosynthetic peptidoglycan transglycosylase [Rhodobacterales bacterium]|nr:monofunctional biosynthetic peptidoglycan transglycosylase [Rhodobacterales bacterium]NCT12945.1 monofunctional biosynthetic peptidoglycan transglycosylase [Rhodobacterales bacterium]